MWHNFESFDIKVILCGGCTPVIYCTSPFLRQGLRVSPHHIHTKPQTEMSPKSGGTAVVCCMSDQHYYTSVVIEESTPVFFVRFGDEGVYTQPLPHPSLCGKGLHLSYPLSNSRHCMFFELFVLKTQWTLRWPNQTRLFWEVFSLYSGKSCQAHSRCQVWRLHFRHVTVRCDLNPSVWHKLQPKNASVQNCFATPCCVEHGVHHCDFLSFSSSITQTHPHVSCGARHNWLTCQGGIDLKNYLDLLHCNESGLFPMCVLFLFFVVLLFFPAFFPAIT